MIGVWYAQHSKSCPVVSKPYMLDQIRNKLKNKQNIHYKKLLKYKIKQYSFKVKKGPNIVVSIWLLIQFKRKLGVSHMLTVIKYDELLGKITNNGVLLKVYIWSANDSS